MLEQTDTLALAQALIAKPSITPADAGCQELITERLRAHHFDVVDLSADKVSNIWARYGHAEPLVIFAGHTDVVDPGPLSAWNTDPFCPTIQDGMLIGRGAQDM